MRTIRSSMPGVLAGVVIVSLMVVSSLGVTWIPMTAGERAPVTPVFHVGGTEAASEGIHREGMQARSDDRAVLVGTYVVLDGSYVPSDPGVAHSDVRIIKYATPVTSRDVEHLGALGLNVEDHLPGNAVLVRGDPERIADAVSLPGVEWSTPYYSAYKFTFPLREFAGEREFDLELYRHIPVASVVHLAGALNARIVSQSDNSPLADPVVAVRTSYGGLRAMVDSPLVKRVWVHHDMMLNDKIPDWYLKSTEGGIVPLNDRAGEVITTHDAWYDKYNGYHVNLMGEGQMAGVADTGFDTGSSSNALEDFIKGPLGNRLGTISGADSNGHGTHVSGSIVGNGYNCETLKGYSTTDREYHLCYAGQAPEAKLTLYGGLGTSNWNNMISQGARALSNSWGPGAGGGYDSTANTVDQIMNSNPAVLILFAAGNDGPAQGTVSGGATSWNGLGIGASENDRPEAGAMDPNKMAGFSSRGGPSYLGGRVKPDLAAPGTAIYSTKSRNAPAGGGGDIPGDANNDGKPDYTSMQGTSMACPTAAGASLVVRDYLMDVAGQSNPNAVLVKALMINGAVDMGYGFPSYDQGWGRINIRNSVSPPAPRTNQFEENTFTSSGSWTPSTMNLDVKSGKVPVKVTLVWQNPNGNTLQNHLDLTVKAPSGTEYHGNKFQAGTQWSEPNPAGYDDVNNVEQVQVDNPEVGTWQVTVDATSVSGSAMAALVFSADVGPQLDYKVELEAKGVAHFVTKAPATLNLPLNLTNFGKNTDSISLTASAPAGITVSFTPTPPISLNSTETKSVTANIDVGSGVSDGAYVFDIVATSGNDPQTPKTSAKITVVVDVYSTDVGTTVQITDTPDSAYDPAVLAFKDASGNKHVFVSWIGSTAQGDRVFLKHSADGGSTWSSVIQVSTKDDGPSYLRMARMPDYASQYADRVFIGWNGYNPAKTAGGSWAYIAYADPADYESQSAWQANNVMVDENTGTGGTNENVKRTVGLLAMGTTAEVWFYFEHLDYTNKGDQQPRSVDVHIKKSSNGGSSFGPATLISPGTGTDYFFFPNGVVDMNDNIQMYFYGRAAGSGQNDRDLYVRVYKSGSWQNWKKIWDTTDSLMFPAAETTSEGAGSNRVYVVVTKSTTADTDKQYYVKYTDDEGGTYTAEQGPFGKVVSQAGYVTGPVLDIDGFTSGSSTTLYVTYMENTNPYGIPNVASDSTSDAFGTVSTQMVTYDSLAKTHKMTDVADGTIYTTYSARNPSQGNSMDVYLKIYGAGGPAPDTYPPYVVDTTPKDGDTGVPTTTTIDIVWNESMNKPSAESAFSSSPSITCTWSWSGVTQTCTPGSALQPNTQYTVTVSTSAKDLAGNAMTSPHTFSFTTGAGGPTPPTVSSTSPQNGATGVPINTNIVITFSEAMDQTATEGAISASPSISGTFSWDGASKVVTWDPGTDLQATTQYTVTVSTAARSQAGANMAADYTFTFTTGSGTGPTPPTVVSTAPADGATDVVLNTKISITFDKAMDRTSTEGAVSSTPAITWSAGWSSADKVLTFTPDADLQANTQYTLTLSTAAKSADGANLASPYTFSFTTGATSDTEPPTVVSTDPADGAADVPTTKKITITFSEAMDTAATGTAVSISPGSITDRTWDAGGKVLTLTVSLANGTKYTVTVSTGAKDLAGNAMAAPYTFTFTTQSGGGGGGGGEAGMDTMTLLLLLLIPVIVVVLLVALLLMRKKRQQPPAGYPPYAGPPQQGQYYQGEQQDQYQQQQPPGY